MEVDGIKGDTGIEDGAGVSDDGSCHHGRKGPRHPRRQYVGNELTVSGISHTAEKLVSDNAGDHHDCRDDQDPHDSCCQNPFLRFLHGGGRHRLLSNILVGRPIEDLDEQHAGKQRVEWNR